MTASRVYTTVKDPLWVLFFWFRFCFFGDFLFRLLHSFFHCDLLGSEIEPLLLDFGNVEESFTDNFLSFISSTLEHPSVRDSFVSSLLRKNVVISL